MKCKACGKTVKNSEIKTCQHCRGCYHHQCLGILTENFNKETKSIKLNWKCPECRVPEKRGDITDTPIRDSSQVSLSKSDSPLSVATFEELKINFDEKMERMSDKIVSLVKKEFRNEIKDIYSKLNDLETSVNFMSNKYDAIQSLLAEETKQVESVVADNRILRSEVTCLINKVNDMEQQSRESNVELQCVPESKSENLLSIVKQLVKTVKSDISDNDIMGFHRVVKMNKDSARPRSLVIKLSSPRKRDNLIAAVKTFNMANRQDRLNASHLGVGENGHAVYVSEHLSPGNKELHAATRVMAKEKCYKFVWIRGGRIFVRK